MSERLIHDVAFAATEPVLKSLGVPRGQWAKMYFAVYTRIKDAIVRYELERERQESRLHPSSN
ncbi:MAG TPA: hypothetical protein VE988_10705 [Gemmataceae bacterium]|nr:hypothetical protein [Gemmataceae bacterium]